MDDIGRLPPGRVKVGTKQTAKTVEQGNARMVYVAQDADSRLVGRILQLCKQRGVPVTFVDTMRNLGKSCGIDVGTAAAAVAEE
ncbi:ribosomal L7Ae/L30e/S12e/Gadd45 family protein [Cohnella zeiphila]|uniref:ribosomal L7Ae/L30e/S12e/Gadd45 family protein n=1 Tax=Cohnella zeiphila TaxID=2761120 RepID=UPI003080DB05